jgi:hypothetical protein
MNRILHVAVSVLEVSDSTIWGLVSYEISISIVSVKILFICPKISEVHRLKKYANAGLV